MLDVPVVSGFVIRLPGPSFNVGQKQVVRNYREAAARRFTSLRMDSLHGASSAARRAQASASCVEDVQGGEFDFGEAQEQLAGDGVAASEVSTQFLPLSSLVCP